MDQMLSLHEVISLAAGERRGELARSEVIHVRLEPALKEMTDKILSQHGVTMSAFMRKCCQVLVTEYKEGSVV